jgi:hypothetical protein
MRFRSPSPLPGLRPAIRALLIAAVLALPGVVRADTPPPATGDLRYDGYFGGLRIADVTLSLNGDGGGYDVHMAIDARGVMGWLYTWHGELAARGRRGEGDRIAPQSFSRAWRDSEDGGRTVVDYDAETGLALGIEDGEPQKQVPDALRRNVLDPLATLAELRRMVLENRHGPATFPVYDGKRRLDLRAELQGARTVEVRGAAVDVAPIAATIEPVAGFSDRQRDGWRQTTLHVLFSTDDKAVPIQIRVHSPVGTAVMTLSCVRTCT